MAALTKAELDIHAVRKEIEQRGGTHIVEKKEGHRKFLRFLSKSGHTYTVSTRAKTCGTWQTLITYGKPQNENILEDHYWVFVDLGYNPPKFYAVPLWWISNDIFRSHEAYLEKHGGHRKRNDSSKHHAIPVNRIEAWENLWSNLEL